MPDPRHAASSQRLQALREELGAAHEDVRDIDRLASESQKLAAQVTPLPTNEDDPRSKIVQKLRRKLRRDPTMAEVLEEELKQTREKYQHDLDLARGTLERREMDYDDVQRKADSLEREARRAKRVAELRVWSGRFGLILLAAAIIVALMALSKPAPVPHYRVEAAAVVTGTSIINVVVVPDHSGKGFTLPVDYRIDSNEMESCSVAMVTTVRLLPNGKIQVVQTVPPGHDDRQDRCNFIPLHK